MKAAILHAYGTPAFGDFPEPEARAGQEVVEVLAATVNGVDRAIASGRHFLSPRELPVVTGIEGVARLSDGARVLFTMPTAPYGSMAQRTLIDPSGAISVPEDVDDATAAALGNAGLAAWLPLSWRVGLQPGERVLILGATGVVGRIAVQAAKLLNAGHVVAAGRDERSLKDIAALGADTVIHTDHADEAGPYDVIVDYTAGPPAEAALRAGAPGVRLVQIGERAGDRIDIPAALLRAKGATVYGFMITHAGQSAVTAAYYDMAQHAAAGRLKVEVEEHSLSEVADLWERASRKKLVLRP